MRILIKATQQGCKTFPWALSKKIISDSSYNLSKRLKKFKHIRLEKGQHGFDHLPICPTYELFVNKLIALGFKVIIQMKDDPA